MTERKASLAPDEEEKDKPLFIYGTLCAMPMLALVITGDSSKVEEVSQLVQKGTVWGWRRFNIHKSYYPTALPRKDKLAYIDGLLFYPQTDEQRRKVDEFEEARDTEEVIVWRMNDKGEMLEAPVEADMWVWDQEYSFLSDGCGVWDSDEFVREGLVACMANYREKLKREEKEKEKGKAKKKL